MHYPDKPRPGDRVAVLSPGTALPAVFPHPFDLGLRRLEERYEVRAVEFPTTRKLGASPAQRAADVHAAFADPDIRAVLTSIGGNDQIKVLAHLDADLLRENPKPFFGLSDNTNLHHFLFGQGLVSYSGGTVMTMLGRDGAMHEQSARSFEAALFGSGWFDLEPAVDFTDMNRDWGDPAHLETEPPMLPGTGWQWHQVAADSPPVEGRLWGGCLEIVDFQLRTGRYLLEDAAYDGCVLFLETSEELPSAQYVGEVLMCLGERGLLQRFSGLLMGRPRAWVFGTPDDPSFRAAYVEAQHAAVLAAFAEYSPDVPVVLDVDLGHTDPNLVVPHGGDCRIDPAAGTVSVRY
ncbi:LD-carboxypeptidase [Nocardioides sp. KIGAM211]|uniref:LD-carboxypeptidase n=1 Tax=Nocardioides luti TaxID=2761101 RepID=A0A7X0RFP0_9ACTN|nr:S66 peptidase family protein [Nocardioides luti]MBB6626198.1 LD-carboxypeptidase [Nocardioides luti]